MLKFREYDPHAVRLRDLLRRFRAQEMSMNAALQDLHLQLEFHHREASYRQMDECAGAAALLRRCAELQAEYDMLAIELVHIRMAISGAGEELADHEGRLLPAGPLAGSQRLGA